MAHSFLGEFVSFSVRIETHYTQVSFLQLPAPVDYPLPDLLSHLVLNLSQGLAECCCDYPAQ